MHQPQLTKSIPSVFTAVHLLNKINSDSDSRFRYPVPTATPQNVAIQSSTATQLDVSWDPPPLDAQNGDIQGYKVSIIVHYVVLPQHRQIYIVPLYHSIAKKRSNEIKHQYEFYIIHLFLFCLKIYFWEFQLQNETERLRTLFLPELGVKLKNLTGYTTYMISVSAFNAAGDGPRSTPTRGRTQQAGEVWYFRVRSG